MSDNQQIISQIAKEFKLDEVIAKILVTRGIDSVEKASSFLYPKIADLTPLDKYVGLDGVAKRLERAIQNKEVVMLYGDYDCDGICGVSILYLYLQSRGVDVHYFLPNRHSHGYGLNTKALEQIAEEYYPDLLITVDCGITSHDEVEYAQEVLGVDVVVTDHHEPIAQLPDCLIFNPKLTTKGAFRNLCGAGVVLRLVEKLAGLDESKKYYDIACLATIADIVPLVEDNRIIAYFGLKLINMGRRRGLRMLVNKCVKGDVKSSDVGFRIAPRINSVGRIGDANKVVGLFVSDDMFVLNNLVEEIDRANETRQNMTQDLVDACMEEVSKWDFENYPIIVLYNKYWDDGVLGIAAAKLVSEFNRPVILLTKSNNEHEYKGSGRSVEGVDILECVSSVSGILNRFGGHTMACGLSLDETKLEQFVEMINKNAKSFVRQECLLPHSNSNIRLDDFDMDFAVQLENLEPCGEGNREIVFNKTLTKCNFEQIGTTEHLKFRDKKVDYLSYFSLDKWGLLDSPTPKNIEFSVSINTFRNTQTLQATIQNISSDIVDKSMGVENFLKLNFGMKVERKPQRISLDDALKSCQDSKFGVCYLCYSYDTYKSLEKYFLNNVIINNTFVDSICPYNRLIFNPSCTCDLTYYKKIVLLDSPIFDGVNNLTMDKNAKLYCVDNYNMHNECKNALVDYATLGKIFVAVKILLDKYTFSDLMSMYKKLDIEVSFDSFCVGMYIFVDLGIVKYDKNGIIIDKGVRTKLDKSRLYQTLL